MVVVGFVTYSWEALVFVNDPFNVSREDNRLYLRYSKNLYVFLCLIMIAYLCYCLVQIVFNYNDISLRQKIFFLFSIYFIFTINLCEFRSYCQRKHFRVLPKRRTRAFGDNNQQLVCAHAAALLHAESGECQR